MSSSARVDVVWLVLGAGVLLLCGHLVTAAGQPQQTRQVQCGRPKSRDPMYLQLTAHHSVAAAAAKRLATSPLSSPSPSTVPASALSPLPSSPPLTTLNQSSEMSNAISALVALGRSSEDISATSTTTSGDSMTASTSSPSSPFLVLSTTPTSPPADVINASGVQLTQVDIEIMTTTTSSLNATASTPAAGVIHAVKSRLTTALNKIVGGHDVHDRTGGQICWQVTLLMLDPSTRQVVSFCGGSILDSRTILTAGHCVLQEDGSTIAAGDLEVWVGVLNRSNSFEARPFLHVARKCGGKYAVEKVIKHPDYSSDVYNNDLAILHLKHPLDFRRPCVCPICVEEKEPAVGEMCVVSGYGVEDSQDENPGATRAAVPLKWVGVEVQTNAEPACLLEGAQADKLICAGNQLAQDSCNGDSGGPLVCWHPEQQNATVRKGVGRARASTGHYYLGGVVSFGPSECGSGQGAQYTKVATFYTWIMANSQLQPTPTPRPTLKRSHSPPHTPVRATVRQRQRLRLNITTTPTSANNAIQQALSRLIARRNSTPQGRR